MTDAERAMRQEASAAVDAAAALYETLRGPLNAAYLSLTPAVVMLGLAMAMQKTIESSDLPRAAAADALDTIFGMVDDDKEA